MEREGQIQCKTMSKQNINIADMSDLNLVGRARKENKIISEAVTNAIFNITRLIENIQNKNFILNLFQFFSIFLA